MTPPDDDRWLDHPIWTDVVVRAESAAMARVTASELERDPDWPGVANESLSFRSAFVDEKLYWVVQIEPPEADAFETSGPPAVLHSERFVPSTERVRVNPADGPEPTRDRRSPERG